MMTWTNVHADDAQTRVTHTHTLYDQRSMDSGHLFVISVAKGVVIPRRIAEGGGALITPWKT